jgi:uncharacterized protein YjaG (DUF416 family)
MMRIIENLRDDMAALGELRGLAFCAISLERALPNYFRFQVDSKRVGGGLLRYLLAKAWQRLEGDRWDLPKSMMNECADAGPDPEDLSSLYSLSAIDAVTIASLLVDFGSSSSVDALLWIAQSRTDSATRLVEQLQSDPDRGHEVREGDDERASLNAMRVIQEDISALLAVSSAEDVRTTALTRIAQVNAIREHGNVIWLSFW